MWKREREREGRRAARRGQGGGPHTAASACILSSVASAQPPLLCSFSSVTQSPPVPRALTHSLPLSSSLPLSCSLLLLSHWGSSAAQVSICNRSEQALSLSLSPARRR